jgi:hypothetical protein
MPVSYLRLCLQYQYQYQCRLTPRIWQIYFWPFFAILAVFFEQVHQQENIHAEIDEGGQASLEVRLSTAQTSDQHSAVIP